VFMCAFIILIIAQNIRPIKFMPPGRVPYKAITKDTFENNNLDEIDIKKYLLYQELLECQFKIDINQYYNTKRLDAMDFIIRFMIICFIVLVVLLLITNNFI
ncbi:MAG: hypothetical protein KDD29_06765, partial [Flavobacteriales bacterium]|nr:hypothetical protein [Flavobacteriales bacterium]